MVKLIIIMILSLLVCNTLYAFDTYHFITTSYSTKINLVNKDRVVSVGLNLVDLKQHKKVTNDHVYDVTLSYSENPPFGDQHGRSTNVHETVHDINNTLKNNYKKICKKDVNAFYAGEGKGIIVVNPKLTMRDIVRYIPQELRGYRYKLYFVDQLGDWNDVPTYPIDEWSCYIAGAECAVDDREHGINIAKSDYVSGSLEFSIYCTALAMSVKQNDPDYWKTYPQFKHMIKYFLIKSEKIFFEGEASFPFEEQEKLLLKLRTHEDAKEMREFLMLEFDGIFVD